MDINESHAEQWLQSQGYTNIRFVTDTNDQPPDFIVNNSIAVEVRRLNLMFGDNNRGLEGVEEILKRRIKSGLNNAEQPPHGCKVFVSCDLFGIDLPDKNTIIQEVKKAASDYVELIKDSLCQGQRPIHSRVETYFGMSIRFDTLTNSASNQFELMGVVAGIDDSGWVANDSIDNINRCIVEKTNKIRDKHGHYKEWWLILVEHNVHPTVLRNTDELQTVRNALVNTTLWSRIIVVSNLEGVPALDLF